VTEVLTTLQPGNDLFISTHLEPSPSITLFGKHRTLCCGINLKNQTLKGEPPKKEKKEKYTRKAVNKHLRVAIITGFPRPRSKQGRQQARTSM